MRESASTPLQRGPSAAFSSAASSAAAPATTETVLLIAIYSPSIAEKAQEFLVLGSNTLAELRDRIYCISDYTHGGQSRMGTSSFLIEGVCYDDRRPGREVDSVLVPTGAGLASLQQQPQAAAALRIAKAAAEKQARAAAEAEAAAAHVAAILEQPVAMRGPTADRVAHPSAVSLSSSSSFHSSTAASSFYPFPSRTGLPAFLPTTLEQRRGAAAGAAGVEAEGGEGEASAARVPASATTLSGRKRGQREISRSEGSAAMAATVAEQLEAMLQEEDEDDEEEDMELEAADTLAGGSVAAGPAAVSRATARAAPDSSREDAAALDTLAASLLQPPLPSASSSMSAAAAAHPPLKRRFLSDFIIPWSLQRAGTSGWGVLQPGSAADTRFQDLSLRIGATYLFLHQGSCQHLMVVMDVRLLCKSDLLDSRYYPRHIFQAKIKRKQCQCCSERSANVIVWGDIHAENDPTFYCTRCREALHLGSNGKPLYSGYFLQPYYHD